MATQIYDSLRLTCPVDYDDAGSIGRRYRRFDSIGTPHCITVDFDSLRDNSVTVRERDSMKQQRVSISELAEKVRGRRIVTDTAR